MNWRRDYEICPGGRGGEFQQVGSMLCCFFTEQKVYDYSTACTSNTARYAAFFKSMLEQGVCLAPSQFEAAFISLAHTRSRLSGRWSLRHSGGTD